MACAITSYNDEVEAENLALLPGIFASFLRITELIEVFGPDLGWSHTAPLGQGLFEIRVIGHEGIACSVFCAMKSQEIVILVTAVKIANKLPKRQMDTERKRMEEVQTDE